MVSGILTDSSGHQRAIALEQVIVIPEMGN
jgi:hypothetical protein